MYYTRAMYKGERTQDGKRMEGNGIYSFPNGDRYVGEFKDGVFHGKGIVFFSQSHGGGQYRAEWSEGIAVKGTYIFQDGLEYDPVKWGYCVPENRRLWREQLEFVAPPHPFKEHPKDYMYATPDYSTTDGIPDSFRDKQPRGYFDVDESKFVDGVIAKSVPTGPVVSDDATAETSKKRDSVTPTATDQVTDRVGKEESKTEDVVEKEGEDNADDIPNSNNETDNKNNNNNEDPKEGDDVDSVVKIQALYRGNRDRQRVKDISSPTKANVSSDDRQDDQQNDGTNEQEQRRYTETPKEELEKEGEDNVDESHNKDSATPNDETGDNNNNDDRKEGDDVDSVVKIQALYRGNRDRQRVKDISSPTK
eukprot:PhM_4_TR15495/c0_g1_i1/m.32504